MRATWPCLAGVEVNNLQLRRAHTRGRQHLHFGGCFHPGVSSQEMGTPVPAEADTICSLYAGWNRLRTTAQLPDAGGPAAAKNLLHPLWQRSMHPAPRQLASLALRQCGQTVCRRGGSRQSKERGSQPTEAQGERRRSAPLTLPLLHFPTRRLHAAQACLAEHRHPVAADGLPDEVRRRGCRRRCGVAARARRGVTDAPRARLAYLIHCAASRGVSKGRKVLANGREWHPKASLDAPPLLTQRAAPQHSLQSGQGCLLQR